MTNTQVVLARRPVGRPRPEDFRVEEIELGEPREGEFLVRNDLRSTVEKSCL